MFRFSPLFSWHCYYTTTDSHMRCTCCHTCHNVTSEVHHQGVQVTGPPPLGPELHHRDVSLPLLNPRAVASAGAAPASLMTRGPQGEPGEGPPAVPVHWPAPGGPGAVGVVTPSVASLTWAWAYLEGLELKWSDVLLTHPALQKTIHLVFLPLVVPISLIHPRELWAEICLSYWLSEYQIPPGRLFFVTSRRTLMMMI